MSPNNKYWVYTDIDLYNSSENFKFYIDNVSTYRNIR